MKRFLYWLFGWKTFRFEGALVCQRELPVDQTVIAKAIADTSARNTWCKARGLTILVEDEPFIGFYGSTATGEVLRHKRFWKTATIRIAARRVHYQTLVDMLEGLSRDDKR